jgi:hypothetical protein
MPIQVWNPKDYSIHLKSFDGDSVLIPAKAHGVQVANKFNWQVPTFMRIKEVGSEIVCPTTIVKGRTPIPSRKPPKAHNKTSIGNDAPFRTASQIRAAVEQKKIDRESIPDAPAPVAEK